MHVVHIWQKRHPLFGLLFRQRMYCGISNEQKELDLFWLLNGTKLFCSLFWSDVPLRRYMGRYELSLIIGSLGYHIDHNNN